MEDENLDGRLEQYAPFYKPDLCDDPGILRLVDISRELLNQHGFPVIDTPVSETAVECVVEFHMYKPIGDEMMSPEFTAHIDDHGATTCKVNTIIFYIEKTGLSGGDLLIYPNGKPHKKSNPLVELIITPIIINRVIVESNKILFLRGDVWHEPETMRNISNEINGVRKCIVVQIRRD